MMLQERKFSAVFIFFSVEEKEIFFGRIQYHFITNVKINEDLRAFKLEDLQSAFIST